MRIFAFVVGLLIFVVAKSHRNLITGRVVPHVRLLIQSVSQSNPQTFGLFVLNKVEQGEFCQAASSLITGGKQSPRNKLPLFNELLPLLQDGTESTRTHLQTLADYFKRDDLRRAGQMKYIWEKTILEEVRTIEEVLTQEIQYHSTSLKSAKTLYDKANDVGTSGEEKKKAHENLYENGFKSVDENYKLDVKANEGNIENPLIGIHSHKIENWKAILEHHTKAGSMLLKSAESLGKFSTDLGEIFASHVSDIERGTEYILKWSPEAQIPHEVTSYELADIGASAYTTDLDEQKSTDDGFEEKKANQLGSHIVDLIADADSTSRDASRSTGSRFEAFLGLDGSPAETMDRLVTTLEILHVRQMALRDAEKSLNGLLQVIGSKMISNKQKSDELIEELGKLLEDAKSIALAVVSDVKRYPKGYNVAINTGSDENLFDQYTKRISEQKTKDALLEFHARTNLLVNSAYQVHVNMLGFQEALKGAEPSNTETAYTTILSFLTNDVETQLGKFNSQSPESIRKAREIIQAALVNARSASECLLYGRFDVLNRNLQRALESDSAPTQQGTSATIQWCTTTHALGIRVGPAGLTKSAEAS